MLFRSSNPILSITEEVVEEAREVAGSITSIFPNPANDLLNINYVIKVPGELSFSISSVTGQELVSYQMDINSVGEYEQSLDISAIPEGVYLISFYLNGLMVDSGKVVKMK